MDPLRIHDDDWRNSYRAALLDKGDGRTLERIAEAQRLIVARARSLFHIPTTSTEERTALDAALSALSILRRYTSPSKEVAKR